MLQRLFRTRRFEEVERWLVDRRIELRRRSQTHARPVCRRAQPVPGGCRGRRTRGVGRARTSTAVAVDGSLTAWADEVCASSAVASAEARSRLDDRHRGPRPATRRARRGHRRSRGPGAWRAGIALSGGARQRRVDAERALVRSLEAHGRAAPVLPLARQSDQAHLDLEAAASEAARHREAVGHAARDGGAGRGRRAGSRGAQRSRGTRRRPVLAAPGAGARARERAWSTP